MVQMMLTRLVALGSAPSLISIATISECPAQQAKVYPLPVHNRKLKQIKLPVCIKV